MWPPRVAPNSAPRQNAPSYAGVRRVRASHPVTVQTSRPLPSRAFTFISHPKAGWCSAVIYSIVGTCRLLSVNPEAYLTWVLLRIPAIVNSKSTRW
jgi:IS66 C-terminal element